MESRFIPFAVNRDLYSFDKICGNCQPSLNEDSQQRLNFFRDLLTTPQNNSSFNLPSNFVSGSKRILNYWREPKRSPSEIPSFLAQDCDSNSAVLKPKFREHELVRLTNVSMVENYYYHLIDFFDESRVTLGINKSLFLFEFPSNQLSVDFEYGLQNLITAVKSAEENKKVYVGMQNGIISEIDIASKRELRIGRPRPFEEKRIGVLEHFNQVVVAGDMFGNLSGYDRREPTRKAALNMKAHEGEVCAIQKDPFHEHILASGGNDNKVQLIDIRKTRKVLHTLEKHRAAVRGMAFNPYKTNMMVTGGGNQDNTLILWDSKVPKVVKKIDVGSQICNVNFTADELILTSHGWPSNNLQVYSLKLAKIATIAKEKNRILHLAINPSRTKIAFSSGNSVFSVRSVKDQLNNSSGKKLGLDSISDLVFR